MRVMKIRPEPAGNRQQHGGCGGMVQIKRLVDAVCAMPEAAENRSFRQTRRRLKSGRGSFRLSYNTASGVIQSKSAGGILFL